MSAPVRVRALDDARAFVDTARPHPQTEPHVESHTPPQDPSQDPTIVLPVPDAATAATIAPTGGAAASTPPTDTTRYTVHSVLGKGGMGKVIKVLDRNLLRAVAMKTVLDPERADAEQVERFVREARITAQLDHPNIIAVHDLGWLGERAPYFTMKLAEGETLDQWLRRVARGDAAPEEYSLQRVLEVFLKVADAVAFAHARGVLHRDIKPSNVFLGRFGEVILMDWGLAKRKGSHEDALPSSGQAAQAHVTAPDVILGTPLYMSPEQAAGRTGEVDERSDLYALGVCLYELLTLQTPFEDNDVHRLLDRVVHEPPPRMREAAAPRRHGGPVLAVPAELEAIVAKALAKRPEDRYADVPAMTRDVRRFLDGESISVLRDSLAKRLRKWARRRPALASSLVVGLLVLFAAGGVFSTLLYRSQSHVARVERERREELERRARATEPYLRGLDLMQRGVAFERAIEELSAAIAIDPRFAEAHFARGEARRMSEDEASAIDDYTTADRLLREQGNLVGSARASYQAAWSLWHSKREEEALPWFERAAVLAPGDPYSRLGEVMVTLWRKGSTDAVALASRLAVDAPHLYEVHELMGTIRLMELEWKRTTRNPALDPAAAVEDFRRATALQPRDPNLWNFRGIALMQTGKLEEADVAFVRAIEVRPSFGSAWHNRAVMLGAGGKLEEAAEMARRCIEAAPDEDFGYVDLAMARIEQGRLAEAEKVLRGLLDRLPDSSKGWNLLGAVCSKDGRDEEALRAMDRAVALDADDPKVRFDRAAVHRMAGRAAEALEDLRVASAMGYTEARYFMAACLDELGRPREALTELEAYQKEAPPERSAEVRGLIEQLKKKLEEGSK